MAVIRLDRNLFKNMEKYITVFASYDQGPEWQQKFEHIEELKAEGFPIRLVPFLKLLKTYDDKLTLQKDNCEEAFYNSFMKTESDSSHFVVHLGIGIRMRLKEFYWALGRYLNDRQAEVPFIFEKTDLNLSHLGFDHPDYNITELIIKQVKSLDTQNPNIEKMIFSYKNER